MTELLRLYAPEECGNDGYPFAWKRTIKELVREEAGNRCLRCGHPYTKGDGEWSRCDKWCSHEGPSRVISKDGQTWTDDVEAVVLRDVPSAPPDLARIAGEQVVYLDPLRVEAQWRILTVHHLDGDKANCRWWNLVSLCQRDHLLIQAKVKMTRPWPWPHTDWFKPYAAAFYAFKYLSVDLSRAETIARLDELLAIGLDREREEGMPV